MSFPRRESSEWKYDKKMAESDEDGNYSLDQDKMNAKIKKYVKKLAEEVDTLGKERPFHTTSGLM